MLRSLALCLGLTIAVAVGAPAQVLSPKPGMTDVRPGEHVTLHLDQPFTGDAVRVFITPDGRKEKAHVATATVKADSLSFPVDRSVPPDRYLVLLSSGEHDVLVPGELRVLTDASEPVTIDHVYPATVYPEGEPGIEIVGTNLGRQADDNVVDFPDGPALEFGTADECERFRRDKRYDKLCIEPVTGFEGRRIRIMGLAAKQYGPLRIRVRVGDGPWSGVKPVVFAAVSITYLRLAALLVLLVVTAGIYLLARTAARTQNADSPAYNWLSVLLLDKDTDTYSLSKFQLLVWTAVFVFSYVYLFFCQLLVRWTFVWPDVPERMPEMLGLSAGAGVIAAGITTAKGSKGAGGIHPSAADFITTGGIVVGERLQYFVWTLVGAFVFLYLALRLDPTQLDDLPKIPERFLYLMGLSSVAYLGGKLARKPGPVVKSISVESVTQADNAPAIRMVLRGENLHRQGTFKVDHQDLRATQVLIVGSVPENPTDGFCTELTLLLRDAAKWVEGPHELTIANPDAQSADVAFPVAPMTVTKVAAPKAGSGAVEIKIDGSNFADPTIAEWKDASGKSSTPAVQRVSDAQLTLNLVPGSAGQGRLTLQSPIGLRTGVDVTVTP